MELWMLNKAIGANINSCIMLLVKLTEILCTFILNKKINKLFLRIFLS